MLGLARFTLCLVFSAVSGYVIAEGNLLPAAIKAKMFTPVGVGCSVMSVFLAASALYWFLEAAATDAAAAYHAMRLSQEDALMGTAFKFRVAVVSNGQARAAEEDHARRVRRVLQAKRNCPMPNRGQIGSQSYGA
jgi:hypothetical protein